MHFVENKKTTGGTRKLYIMHIHTYEVSREKAYPYRISMVLI